MKIIFSCVIFVASAMLSGCASRSDIEKSEILHTYTTQQKAIQIASCIDTNVDNNSALGSLQSKIIYKNQDEVDVVVLNGGVVHASVKIKTIDGLTKVDFRYGGVAYIFPEETFKMMAMNCT